MFTHFPCGVSYNLARFLTVPRCNCSSVRSLTLSQYCVCAWACMSVHVSLNESWFSYSCVWWLETMLTLYAKWHHGGLTASPKYGLGPGLSASKETDRKEEYHVCIIAVQMHIFLIVKGTYEFIFRFVFMQIYACFYTTHTFYARIVRKKQYCSYGKNNKPFVKKQTTHLQIQDICQKKRQCLGANLYCHSRCVRFGFWKHGKPVLGE